MKIPLIWIKGSCILVKGTLEILDTISTHPESVFLKQTFMVINMALAYNIILYRPFLHQINVVISTGYLSLKFTTKKRVVTMRGNHVSFTYLRGKKTLALDQQGSLKEKVKMRIEIARMWQTNNFLPKLLECDKPITFSLFGCFSVSFSLLSQI